MPRPPSANSILNKARKEQIQRKTPIATDMYLPNHSGDHSKGRVNVTPTTDLEIVNKKFVDDQQGNHDIADHNDTSATGAELDTLTDDSMADTLHRHSELSASDGSPDAVFSIEPFGLIASSSAQISITYGSDQLKLGDGFASCSFRAAADDGLRIAPNHLNTTCNNNVIITSNVNRGVDHDHDVPSTNPHLFIHSQTSPNTDNTQWISFSHNQADGVIETGKGDLILDPASDKVGINNSSPEVGLHVGVFTPHVGHVVTSSNDIIAAGKLEVQGQIWSDSRIYALAPNSTPHMALGVAHNSIQLYTSSYLDDGLHLSIEGAEGSSNNNIIITELANYNKDHDHDTASANPTLFLHSNTDPNTDNTQWGSLTHDQTDFLISSGTGGIKTDRDLFFTGEDSGLLFGEIYVYDNSTADSVPTGTWTQMTRFDTDGLSNGTTPDHTNDHITVLKAGKYKVSMSCSFSGDPNITWFGGVFTNNGANQMTNAQAHRKLGAGGDVGSVSATGIIDLAANDTVEIWFRHEAGVNKNITIVDCTLNVTMLGGT